MSGRSSVGKADLAFLIAEKGEKVEALIDRIAGQDELTASRLGILRTLVKASEPISITEISDRVPLKVDQGRRVDELWERDLLSRYPDPEWRRRTLVEITDQGQKLYEQLASQLGRKIASGLEVFEEEELRILVKVLSRM